VANEAADADEAVKAEANEANKAEVVSMKRSITQLLLPTVLKIISKCQQQSISIPVDCHMQPP
jgi:hypothetical protein